MVGQHSEELGQDDKKGGLKKQEWEESEQEVRKVTKTIWKLEQQESSEIGNKEAITEVKGDELSGEQDIIEVKQVQQRGGSTTTEMWEWAQQNESENSTKDRTKSQTKIGLDWISLGFGTT